MESTVKFHVSYLDNENKLSEMEEIVLRGTKISCVQLLSKISEVFGLSADDFDLYFGLKCLEYSPEQKIEDMGLKSGCRLHAIQKKLPVPKKESEPVDYSSVQNAAHGLRTMFNSSRQSRRRSKSKIVKLFEDKEALDAIIDSVEGLADDQTALDILENVKLFEAVLDAKNLKTIIEKHPSLANAFMAIWNSLLRSNVHTIFDPLAGTSSESQESMDVNDSSLSSPPSASRSASSSRQDHRITSSQLAAAIAQATTQAGGATFPYSAYNTPTAPRTQRSTSNSPQSATSTPSTGSRSRQPVITQDEFSQAMQQALMSTGLQEVAESLHSDSASGATPAISEDAMQTGLSQLRAMGITDDEASREALTATQGNVEAAVNLLFSGS